MLLHPERCALQVSGHDVENAADAHRQDAGQFFFVLREPELLLGDAHADQKNFRPGRANVLQDFPLLGLVKEAVMRTREGKSRMRRRKILRCRLGHARCAAQKVDRPMFLRRFRQKPLRQIGAGDSFWKRRPQDVARPENPRTVRHDQIRFGKATEKPFVAPCQHQHFRIRRQDDVRLSRFHHLLAIGNGFLHRNRRNLDIQDFIRLLDLLDHLAL